DNLFLVVGDHRPAVPLRPRHLRVHEHVLELLAPAPEPVAGAASPNRQTGLGRLDRPGAPPHGAVVERDTIVFAHGPDPSPEITVPGSVARGEQLEQRLLHSARETRTLVGEPPDVLLGGRME